MAPKRPAPKGPKLIHGYTPLISSEAWLSTMGKKANALRIDIRLLPVAIGLSALTSAHPPLPSFEIGNATRVPEYPKTRVNPAVFKPVNPGLRAGKNPGLRV